MDEAIKCLKEGGMIVLADSDRMIEKNAVDYSESKGSFKWISADLVQLTVIAGQRQFL